MDYVQIVSEMKTEQKKKKGRHKISRYFIPYGRHCFLYFLFVDIIYYYYTKPREMERRDRGVSSKWIGVHKLTEKKKIWIPHHDARRRVDLLRS